MKIKDLILHVCRTSLLAALLTSCAGVDPTGDPALEDGGNGANENFGNENLGNENFNSEENEELDNENLNGNNLNNNNLNNNNLNNELVNNSAGENFLANDEEALDGNSENAAEEENSTQDFGIEEGNDIIVDGNPINNGNIQDPAPNIEQGATDAAITETAPVETDSEQPATSPSPGSGKKTVVRYVVKGGASAYDNPNGTSVKSVEQGDHPLVSEDGEWSRTSDGLYIPASSLTPSPVGRAKTFKEWR